VAAPGLEDMVADPLPTLDPCFAPAATACRAGPPSRAAETSPDALRSDDAEAVWDEASDVPERGEAVNRVCTAVTLAGPGKLGPARVDSASSGTGP
jgi:hypothetical protein